MAAYAALTSLMHIIDDIEHHPFPPISLDKQQLESLTENVTFFQEFLEGYNSRVADGDEADPLERRIADAAYAAEDVIESHIVDMIKLRRSNATNHPKIDPGEETSTSAGSKNRRKPMISFNYFGCMMKPINHGRKINFIYSLSQSLRKVIKDMDMVKKAVMETTVEAAQLQRNVSAIAGSLRSSIIVGFNDDDEVLLEVLEKLTAGGLRRQVIPIVGMGGIGKTTLARHVYARPLIKEYFDICVWATISQQYNTKQILCDLISQANKKNKEELSKLSEEDLGSELYKYLSGRRFLIVLDDMWSIDAWNTIQHFFPNNENGSRVVVTTRQSQLSSQLNNNYCLQMKFLDEVSSWDLFSKSVFGEEHCPLELEEIGKKIVENCRGLPLSIVVVGGLLKKMEHTKECWESIRKNSSSVVNSVDEEFCLKILKMSYNHLPVYLKPCFIYMGVFEEDRAVRVSTLIKLWVSEGFLKPVSGISLEMAAKEYLNDLVDRNLILVHELGCTGNIKYCKIHDLLRDLCWREAEKEGFYNVMGQHKFQGLNRQRCVVIPGSTSKEEVRDAFQSMLLARSFICDSKEVVPLPKSRLLRTLKAYDRDTTSGSHEYWLDDLFGLVNSRYLAVGVHEKSEFPSLVGLLWNLKTLIIFHSRGVTAPDEIWTLPQLRHVECHKGELRLLLTTFAINENLQTLKGVHKVGERLSTVIPNIKKLGVTYAFHFGGLTKLESLRCCPVHWSEGNAFPNSLKKLSLGPNSNLDEGMLRKIGALPLLQKLRLNQARFPNQWETREGEFRSLKFLELNCCILGSWMTESSHFPRLEKLHLYGLRELEEIPWEIGEISTLQSILLEYCSESLVESAKKIAEEEREELQVRVVLFNNSHNQPLRSLASPNFLVEIADF